MPFPKSAIDLRSLGCVYIIVVTLAGKGRMSQDTQLGHAFGSGKRTHWNWIFVAHIIFRCFSGLVGKPFQFPMVGIFLLLRVSSIFPPFATEKPMFFVNVRDLGVQGHVGIPGMFSLGKWRQGGMIFGENSLNLMANPFQLMGITYLMTTLFRGHDFWGGYDFIHICTGSTFQGASIKPWGMVNWHPFGRNTRYR